MAPAAVHEPTCFATDEFDGRSARGRASYRALKTTWLYVASAAALPGRSLGVDEFHAAILGTTSSTSPAGSSPGPA
jgi:hypothetical protein